ncbi:lytic exoenzyme target recognition domain-containing protein [Leuconostoc sp.]|uniref:lytic exoenzyme target recognition domain-containing protein n=1 Tax=Leuconostoc sp. TaxID=1930076 RepID=UPI002958A56C|nr:lytic exoenzyme target recognition domain-containing protein [Leuconostoc sp.]MDV8935963.1 N-acetylmuramoyl-L-alanine amidase [Leuconostoc sp.]
MVEVIRKIVVPNGLAQQNGYSVPPYTSVHAHDTGNPNSSMQNEHDYLAGHYGDAFYTHLVGWNPQSNKAEAWQVAEKNQGAWDLGSYLGNANGYASIEFVGGSIKTQSQFNAAYTVYVNLLRQLADECGAKKTLDETAAISASGAGYIVTHNFASRNGFGSSHIDPLNFLAKWGISYEQFKKDVKNAKASSGSSSVQKVSTSKPSTSSSSIQQFKNAGNHFTNTKTFKVDKIAKVNGIWQMINYALAGGKDANWTSNGIPLDIVDNVTRGMSPTQIGDVMRFSRGYDNGTIDKYDTATNGVGIVFGKYGIIWFNADAFIKL